MDTYYCYNCNVRLPLVGLDEENKQKLENCFNTYNFELNNTNNINQTLNNIYVGIGGEY
jgi:hypothetical protein